MPLLTKRSRGSGSSLALLDRSLELSVAELTRLSQRSSCTRLSATGEPFSLVDLVLKKLNVVFATASTPSWSTTVFSA